MKIIWKKGLTVIICMFFMVSLCKVSGVFAADAMINKSKVTLEKDGYIKLKMVGTSEKVKWSSKNKKIAKVSSKGTVTAISEGTTTITATLSGKKYTCLVSVVDSNKPQAVKEYISDDITTIKEKKLYSKEGVTITAKGFEKNNRDYYVAKILIENNSGDTLRFYTENQKINGFSFINSTSVTLYDGKKATIEIGAKESDLNVAGIAHVMEIDADIVIYEAEGKNKIDVAHINVHTSEYGKYNQSYDFSGTEVYNRDGIQILAAKASNPSIEYPFMIYIHNTTDRKLSIMYKNIAFNDELVYTFYSGFHAAPDSYAIVRVYLPDLGYTNITDLKCVDFTTVITPFRLDGSFSTGDMIYSDQVTITY